MNTTKKRKLVVYFTSGGPAPAMNAVTRAVVLILSQMGYVVIGLQRGLENARQRNFARHILLDATIVNSIRDRGGSILGNARASLKPGTDHLDNVLEMISYLEDRYSAQLAGVIGNGGNDTFESVVKIFEKLGVPVLHLAKTIDNDLWLPNDVIVNPFEKAPDVQFPGAPSYGFPTVCDSMGERICATVLDAETSGSRFFLVETMGRLPGWIAYGSSQVASSLYRDYTQEHTEGPLQVTRELLEHLGINELSLERLAEIIGNSLQNRLGDDHSMNDVCVYSEGIKQLLDKESSELLAKLAETTLDELPKDEFGHPELAELPIERPLVKRIRKVLGDRVAGRPLVMGYGARCIAPHIWDLGAAHLIGQKTADIIEEGKRVGGTICAYHGQGHLLPFEDTRKEPNSKTDYSMRLRLLPEEIIKKHAAQLAA